MSRIIYISQRAGDFIFGADHPCGFLVVVQAESKYPGKETFELQ